MPGAGEKIIHENLTGELRIKYLGAVVAAVGVLVAVAVAAVGVARGQFDLAWTVKLGFCAGILSVTPMTYLFSENAGLARGQSLWHVIGIPNGLFLTS